jgi:CHAT domain-containing protein
MMSLFYENLLVKKLPKREAFTQAQNKLKEKYGAPYYWGAFVMVGE